MLQVLQDFRSGVLRLAAVPAPLGTSTELSVSCTASLISAGTEKMLVDLAQKSLIGKAKERPDQVKKILDKVKKEGLASTLQKVQAQLSVPLPLGYSAVGRVLTAHGVPEYRPGQLVACAGAKVANHAEILAVPRNLCVAVPDGVTAEQACYVTLGAIALQGVRLAVPTLGESFLVVGLGLLGQITVQLLKANGCRVLAMDIDPEKVALAVKLGADEGAVGNGDARKAAETFTRGRGVDGVIITAATSSNEPVELAGDVCRLKGRVVAVGAVKMDIPRKTYYDKELDLRLSRSYGPGRYDPEYEEHGNDYPLAYVRWTEQRNMEAFLDLIANKRIDVDSLTTHTFPIDRALEAYEIITGKAPAKYMGIVLTYPGIRPEDSARIPITSAARPRSTAGRLGLGLVGAGGFARGTLLPALAKMESVRCTGIATATGVTSKAIGEKYSFVYAASSADQLVDDPETEAVLIATRHGSHAEIAAKALRAGKHVFVEKPLAVDRAQLNAVTAAYEASGRTVMVGFNRRFAPLAAEMKAAFAKRRGPMMVTYRVNAGVIPNDHWIQHATEGGGRLIGEACHFVDFVQFLTGAEPVTVHTVAAGGETAGVPLQDNSLTTLQMSDGSVATILYTAAGDTAFSKERVEAFADGSVAVLNDFRTLWINRSGKETRKKATQDKGHAAGLAAFVEAIRQGKESPIPFRSLWLTTAATFAMMDSLACGVPLPVMAEVADPDDA